MPIDFKQAWAAPCGVCCRLCEFFENTKGLSCGGCLEERLCRPGEEQCKFIACTHRHGIEHCGLCDEFPCEQLIRNYQPNAGESPRIAVFRIGDLAIRRRVGTKTWLKRKIEGSLPSEHGGSLKVDTGTGTERRQWRRRQGTWRVPILLLPATEAFGLSNIEAQCVNISPGGLLLRLPESAREGMEALIRTGRTVDVHGEFPTALGGYTFSGKVVWHKLEQAPDGGGFLVGIRFEKLAERTLEVAAPDRSE